jgi:hypothetical protein
MTTVLITGATGFLGSYLTAEFLNHGYKVIAVGRNPERLEQLQHNAEENTQLSTIASDLSGLNQLTLPAIDVVVHAAALSTIWGPWAKFFQTNVEGTRHVLQLCHNQAAALVFISSPSVYSARGDRPGLTEQEINPANRLNNYIRSKIQAEAEINNSGIDAIILRPRGLIGIGDTSIVPRLMHANDTFGLPLFRGGRNLVDMTCVENVALAAQLAAAVLVAQQPHQQVYNITNGEPREFKQITDQLFTGLGITPRYKPRNVQVFYGIACALEVVYKLLRLSAEPPLTKYTVCTLGYSQTLDISAARRDLNYQPRVSLDEGISNYVKHHT